MVWSLLMKCADQSTTSASMKGKWYCVPGLVFMFQPTVSHAERLCGVFRFKKPFTDHFLWKLWNANSFFCKHLTDRHHLMLSSMFSDARREAAALRSGQGIGFKCYWFLRPASYIKCVWQRRPYLQEYKWLIVSIGFQNCNEKVSQQAGNELFKSTAF